MTFTKERLEQYIKNPLEHGLTRSEQMEMARQLLTSMEQEPVAFIDRANLDYLESGADADVWPASGAGSDDVLLYAAPQLPQPAVVLECLEKLRSLVADRRALPRRKEWISGQQYSYVLLENVEGLVEEACRAAMLQGAEQQNRQQNIPENIPFEQWLSQQTGTIDVECGCVMTEVFFHWLRVAYEAGNSSQCREISNSSTNNFRENAETSTKCWCRTCRPVTFADSHFVVCPECGNKRCPHANDHRHACTGSNEPGQEGSAYPAAPQQEVK